MEAELAVPLRSGVGEVGERTGRQVVDGVDIAPLGEQAVHERRTDEPCAPRDHDPHRAQPSLAPSPASGRRIRAPDARAPAPSSAPAPMMVWSEAIAPAPSIAPSPTTESMASASGPRRACGCTTERNTRAPPSTTAPAPSTDPATRAPGP